MLPLWPHRTSPTSFRQHPLRDNFSTGPWCPPTQRAGQPAVITPCKCHLGLLLRLLPYCFQLVWRLSPGAHAHLWRPEEGQGPGVICSFIHVHISFLFYSCLCFFLFWFKIYRVKEIFNFLLFFLFILFQTHTVQTCPFKFHFFFHFSPFSITWDTQTCLCLTQTHSKAVTSTTVQTSAWTCKNGIFDQAIPAIFLLTVRHAFQC